jgi:predicted RNase H-like HicB family nuclease
LTALSLDVSWDLEDRWNVTASSTSWLEAAEHGGFVVSVPDLPGCWTQGETRDKALPNAKEAITGYLEALDELGKPLPKPQQSGKWPKCLNTAGWSSGSSLGS